MFTFVALIFTFAASEFSFLDDCPLAPSNPQDRRTDLTQLRVATFNLEWLFNANSSSKSPWRTPSEVHQHIETLANIIDKVNADVWFLQEVQSDCGVLEKLRAALFDPSPYRFYLVKGTDTATGMKRIVACLCSPSRPERSLVDESRSDLGFEKNERTS
jgi:hypothetical protein